MCYSINIYSNIFIIGEILGAVIHLINTESLIFSRHYLSNRDSEQNRKEFQLSQSYKWNT